METKPIPPEIPTPEANLAYIRAYAHWSAQLPETFGVVKLKGAPCARCGTDTGAPYNPDLSPTYCQRCDLEFDLWEKQQALKAITLDEYGVESARLLRAKLAVANAKIALLEFDAARN